jgi:hypothetical protein
MGGSAVYRAPAICRRKGIGTPTPDPFGYFVDVTVIAGEATVAVDLEDELTLRGKERRSHAGPHFRW